MKYAVPVTDNKLSQHFGHCELFAIFNVDPEKKTIISKEMIKAPEHQPGLLPVWLAEQNVNTVIAGGMGMHAQQLFREKSIQVVVGAIETDPEKAVIKYVNDNLDTGENLCDH